jgi:hypothetical protein
MKVLRGQNTLMVNGVAYNLHHVVDAAFIEAKVYGSDNPAFHMPGWFYTNSPYAEQITQLIIRHKITQIPIPNGFKPEFLPKLGKVWRNSEPKWITHYGVKNIYEREQDD